MSLESSASSLHAPRFQGIILLVFLGGIWLFIGLMGLKLPWVWILLACSIVSIVLLWLSTHWFRGAPHPPPQILVRRKLGFMHINILQSAAIFLGIFSLIRLGYPQYIPGVLCAIVGFHFLALAPIFRQSEFKKTGASLLIISGLGVLATLLGSDKPISLIAIPAGLALWITAVIISHRG